MQTASEPVTWHLYRPVRPVPPGTGKPIRAIPAPGRNEACPCGSGLKYKRCCLGSTAVRPSTKETDRG